MCSTGTYVLLQFRIKIAVYKYTFNVTVQSLVIFKLILKETTSTGVCFVFHYYYHQKSMQKTICRKCTAVASVLASDKIQIQFVILSPITYC